MVSPEQFEKARDFVYRHGSLLTRKRFAYHFEGGSKQAVIDVLACYQNDDGGFGNGLELDLMCPPSSGICMEMALGLLLDLGVSDGPIVERAMVWILSNRTANGDLPHPVEAAKAYPHGNWWEQDSQRILSVAGLLARMGINHPEISSRADTVFEATYIPFPAELGVYHYPGALYLRYADQAGKHSNLRKQLETAFEAMLQKDAWHHPLFLVHNRWDSPDIPTAMWRSKSQEVLTTLQDDGGVMVERYTSLPWHRPVWTLEMLVMMKDKGLLPRTT